MAYMAIGTPARPAVQRGPGLRRAALAAAVLAGAAAGACTVAPEAARAVAGADDGLARLLRFMALLKGSMVLAALGAVLWRLGEPASLPRLAAYLAAGAAAAAGPGLIWNMAHLGLGAVLLHGGLFALLVLLWRDPAVSARLAAAVERRRVVAPRGAGQRGGGFGKASTPPV